jgi:hypothetical protein
LAEGDSVIKVREVVMIVDLHRRGTAIAQQSILDLKAVRR